MNQTPDQATINRLVQSLRPKPTPKAAESNGHAEGSADRLSNTDVLENLFGEDEGQKWRDLYNGSWEQYYDSQSSADAALLHKLAWWTDRDPAQMEQIARGSGLARQKWDSRRGGSTWLVDEIARAFENTPEGFKPKARDKVRSRSRSLGNTGMSNDPEQSIRAVSFRGRKKPGPREWIVERAICKGHAFGIAAEECGRIGAGLFIVDSVGFALEGDGELSKDVLRFHKECLRPIKEAGATPHLIDHQAKVIKGEKYSDKQEFGSVYKTNSVRSSFQIRGAWDGNELTTTFTHRKTNFGPKIPAFSLKLLFGGGRVKVERLEEAVPNPDRGPSKKEQVFEAVEELGRATAETVARKTGISLQTVRNAVSELVSEGALKDTGEKQGRSRIVVTHSQTTKGTGTGTKAQADAGGYQEAF